MNIDHLKPIPEHIKKIIADRYDEQDQIYPNCTRYYAYLDMVDRELVKVTVAVKLNDIRERVYKQVTVHCLHDKKSYVKDFAKGNICGYITGWCYEGLSKRCHFFEDREWGYDPRGGFDCFARIVNKNYIHRTRYKYSGAIEYGGDNLLAYIRTWEQFPKVEYLSKIGLGCLAFRKSILKKAMKDKAFVRWLIEHKDDIRNSNWNATNIIYAYNHHISVCDADLIRFFVNTGDFDKPNIKRVIDESEYLQLAKYIKEQGVKVSVYDDYLKACLYLDLDMSLPKNRYPHDLRRWHDIRTLEYASKKADDEEAGQNRIASGVVRVAEKYAFLETSNEMYSIFIAKSKKELQIEGEVLHHCVGRMGYDTKIAEERSLVFFLRLAEEPTMPYVTIEYDLEKLRVAQYHAKNNYAPVEPVREYIEKIWAPMVTKQLKKLKKAA